MRKRIALLSLILFAIGVLIGCNSPASTAPPTLTAIPAPATITSAPIAPILPPSLAPSVDQMWARAQTCKCLVVYAMPETGANIILKAIENAKKSVRLKMYLFTRDDVRDALIAASKRGVDVRVLMELNPYGQGATNVDIYNAMKGTPVKFRWASYDFRFTHEKSLTIDDQIAFIMTHNITSSSFNSNREFGVLDSRIEDVAEIIKVFEADWEKVQPDLKNARLVWSPVNARQKWIELIDSATVSIDLEQNEWYAPEIVARVVAAAKRGVTVRGIFTPRDPITADDGEPNRELVRQAGGQVKYVDDPYIHAKMFLIDGQRAFVGSENVSDNSLNNNRELGIIFDQPDAIAVLRQTFEKDWGIATVQPFPSSEIPIPANGIVNWKDAPKYYNREVTLEGKIVKIYNSGKVMFLQFSDTPETDAKVVIFPSDWGKWTQRPDLLFNGKTIRVTGKVVKYQGAPEIIINDPKFIVAVDK